MLYFHSCPKCTKGTIEYGSDEQGNYIMCLMCGFYKNSAQGITKARKSRNLIFSIIINRINIYNYN